MKTTARRNNPRKGEPNVYIHGHSTRAFVVNPIVDGQRRCLRCSETKPVSEFYRRPEAASGYRGVCKECMKPMNVKRVKAYYYRHPDRSSAHNYKRPFRAHGITGKEYAAYLEQQGHVCAICKTTNPKGRGKWHIDHCHKTGKIRGLLCNLCNLGLGAFRDSPEALVEASKYLLAHQP